MRSTIDLFALRCHCLYDRYIEKAARLKPTNKSWRVDETYLRVRGRWYYPYRAIHSAGATLISCCPHCTTPMLPNDCFATR